VNALRPAPGSTLWLLLHELQLNLRGVTAARGAKVRLIVLGAILTIGTFAGGVPLALMLRRFPIEPNGFLDLSFDLAVVMIFTLILSQTLSATVLTFFERGDLELLLSSPMPPRRALAVKAVGVAMTPFLWFALFLTPVAAPMALLGQPRWLADYLVLASISLLASAAGVSLAMALFRLIGARRTRSVGQLLAALIGAVFFLVSQARTFMPDGGHAAIGRMARLIQSGAFDPGAPLSWPARAVMGEPIPLVVFVGVSRSRDRPGRPGRRDGQKLLHRRLPRHGAQGAAPPRPRPDPLIAGAAPHALCGAADVRDDPRGGPFAWTDGRAF
jgi:ABC-2 type transport system permease protein